MTWLQMWVKAPPGNGYTTPEAMSRVDDHLTQQFPATMCRPEKLPVQETDGTWEVRIFDANPLIIRMVKGILTEHYGLEIVREVTHKGV
jgi:hypothetical protein